MKKQIICVIVLCVFLVFCAYCSESFAWGPKPLPQEFAPTDDPQGTFFSGGLLGAVLLGEPFKGITIPDVLALLGLALIGYRLFLLTRDNSDRRTGGDSSMDDEETRGPGMDSEAYRRARAYWEHMNGKSDGSESQGAVPPPAPGPSIDVAKHGRFDTDDFLKGAKLVYGRIHDAVRNKDYEDLAAFTTPEILERIRNKPGTLAKNGMIMFVEAELLDVTDIGGETKATVRFKALVQYADKGKSEDVSEVWHFRKNSGDSKDTWRLQDTEHFQ